MSQGFSEEDRKKVTFGTILTVIGGVFLACFKAMGFVLRAIFGGMHYGLFAIAQNVTEMLAYFLVGGFNDAIVYLGAKNVEGREAAKSGDMDAPTISDEDGLYRTMATCIGVPLVISLVLVALIQIGLPWVYALVWADHDPILLMELVRVLICALPFMLLCQLTTEALKIFLDLRWQVGVVQVFLPSVTGLYAVLLVLVGGMGIEAIVWALLGATITATPIALYGFSRRFSLWRTLRHFVSLRLDKEVLHFAIPQSLNMMLNLGMVRVDSLMLSGFVDANAVGIYSLISDLTQLIRLAKMAFSAVFSPLVAKYQAQRNRMGIQEALHTLVRFTSSLSIPLLIIMMVMYPHFVLSKTETWQYSRIFPWLLCIGPMMSCFFGLAGNLLLMTGHPRLLLFNAVVSSIVNVVLNLIFIPHFGLLGAAMATGISNFLISSMQIVEMALLEKLTLPPRLYGWQLLAGAVPVVAAIMVFTAWGQRMVSAMPSTSGTIQAGLYAAIAIVLYAVVLFLPPGGFHKVPLQWLRKRRRAA